MAIASSKLDVHVLANTILCLDFCLEGRLLGHAQLCVSDVKHIIKITEAMGNMVFQHRNWFTDRCPASKERCTAIKNTYREVNIMTSE